MKLVVAVINPHQVEVVTDALHAIDVNGVTVIEARGHLSPAGALIIGGIAAVVVVFGIDFIEWLRVDDPIGAVAVHGFAGIFGTLSIGV